MAARLSFIALCLILSITSVLAKDDKPVKSDEQKVKKLLLRAVYSKEQLAETPHYPKNATSFKTFAGHLYTWVEVDQKKWIGYSDGVITVLLVTKNKVVFDVDFTYDFLLEGKVLVKGNADSKTVQNYLAITGGTAKYFTARGQAVRTILDPKDFKFKNSTYETKIELQILL